MFFKSGLYVYEPTFDSPAIALLRSVAGAPSTTQSAALTYLTGVTGLKISTTGAGNITLDAHTKFVNLADTNFLGIPTTTRPAASVTYRGKIIYEKGVSDGPPPAWTADHLYVCLKDNLNAYNWVQIA